MYMRPKGFSFEREIMKRVFIDGVYLELLEIEKDIKSIGELR